MTDDEQAALEPRTKTVFVVWAGGASTECADIYCAGELAKRHLLEGRDDVRIERMAVA